MAATVVANLSAKMVSPMKEKVSLGLDVGNRHINMVKLADDGQGWRLLDFVSVKLDPRQGKEEKIRALEKIAQEKGIASLPVNIAVSGASVVVRYTELPKMNKEEMTKALEYEAQQYIPFKMEEVIFDYHILESLTLSRNRMKILLVAAKKEAITEFIKLIQQAGLKLNFIDVNAFSLINCFQFNGPKVEKDDVFALVNLEFDLVNINILQGETPFFTRDFSLLENVLSLQPEEDNEKGIFETMEPLLTNLIRELQLSIDYYENEFERQVSVIYLSGEGASVPELIGFFTEQLGREVCLWNPTQNLIVDSTQIDTGALKDVSCMLVLACGLALRGK